MIFKLKSGGVLILKCEVCCFILITFSYMFLENDNMFLVNGNMFLVNSKQEITYQMLKHITISLKYLTKRRKPNVCTIALYPNQ